jgi:hypothetical protein
VGPVPAADVGGRGGGGGGKQGGRGHAGTTLELYERLACRRPERVHHDLQRQETEDVMYEPYAVSD